LRFLQGCRALFRHIPCLDTDRSVFSFLEHDGIFIMSNWHSEPRLDDLLADPATRLVMSGDHVQESALRGLLAQVRNVLGERRRGSEPLAERGAGESRSGS